MPATNSECPKWVIVKPGRIEVRLPDKDGEYELEVTNKWGDSAVAWLTVADADRLIKTLGRGRRGRR